jgi:mannose/cellobiose epimerase-like protein (N-acyl-D-glucosamine 2-epimerase family)
MRADLGKIPVQRLTQLREHYHEALFEDVVPWWEKHSFDRECGGYYSCLDCDGRPWSTDKYMWMTGREIWMFSHLYNCHKKNPAWLNAARLGADFVLKHAFQPDGKMYFRLTREGRPMSKVLSLFSELYNAITAKAATSPSAMARFVPSVTRSLAPFTLALVIVTTAMLSTTSVFEHYVLSTNTDLPRSLPLSTTRSF